MNSLVLTYIVSSMVLVISAQDICPAMKRLGCFNSIDESTGGRLLPKMLFSDRGKIMWTKWNGYIADLACRCAAAAIKAGYDVFAIEFYGECWGAKTYRTESISSKCIGDDYNPCNDNSTTCVGQANTIALYTTGFCVSKPVGIYTDPESCSGFLQCIGGFTFRRQCPLGRQYNTETKKCDDPKNVECGSRD